MSFACQDWKLKYCFLFSIPFQQRQCSWKSRLSVLVCSTTSNRLTATSIYSYIKLLEYHVILSLLQVSRSRHSDFDRKSLKIMFLIPSCRIATTFALKILANSLTYSFPKWSYEQRLSQLSQTNYHFLTLSNQQVRGGVSLETEIPSDC